MASPCDECAEYQMLLRKLRHFLELYIATYMATDHHPTTTEELKVVSEAQQLRKVVGLLESP